MAARIQVPKEMKRGDIFEVRLVIQHPMETGFRFDDVGKRIPRNVITSVECNYNGVEIFSASLSSGISANPYLQFSTRAVDSGELVFTGVDDLAERGTERAALTVTG